MEAESVPDSGTADPLGRLKPPRGLLIVNAGD